MNRESLTKYKTWKPSGHQVSVKPTICKSFFNFITSLLHFSTLYFLYNPPEVTTINTHM